MRLFLLKEPSEVAGAGKKKKGCTRYLNYVIIRKKNTTAKPRDNI